MNGREKMFYLSDAVNRINFKEKIPAKVRTNIKNGEEKIFKVVTKVNSMVNIWEEISKKNKITIFIELDILAENIFNVEKPILVEPNEIFIGEVWVD